MSSIEQVPVSLSRQSCLRAFETVASCYENADVVAQTTGEELLSRLDLVARPPAVIIDVGAGSGRHVGPLLRRYPNARLVLLEPCASLLDRFKPGLIDRLRWRSRITRLHGFAESIEIDDASVDLVFANQSLQWCELEPTLAEFRRILRPSGLLSFATVGPDTLHELRVAWQQVCGPEAAESRLHRFLDMHDLGDALIQAGFSEPVMDMDHLTLTYADAQAMFVDLRSCGARNARSDRPRALTGKALFNQYVEKLNAQRDSSGRIPLTFELVYGQAWVAGSRSSAVHEDGPIPVSFNTDRARS